MARKCDLTGKIRQSGHNVSHANNKTKRVFNANLQKKKIFVPSLGKSVRIKLSTQAIRTIDKLGVDEAFRKYGMSLATL